MNAEQVARGMHLLHQAGAYCGTCDYQDGMCQDCKHCLRSYLAALEPLIAEFRAAERKQAAQSIREEAVDEAIDGKVQLTAVIRMCEEVAR